MKKYKYKACEMSKEDRERAVQVIGNEVLMLEEGYSIERIAVELDLEPYQVVENIYETLYQIRRRVGRWNFFKELFIK